MSAVVAVSFISVGMSEKEYPEKITNLRQGYWHILTYQVHLVMYKNKCCIEYTLSCTKINLTASLVIGYDCIGTCISTFHIVTGVLNPPPPSHQIRCTEIIHY